MEHSTLPEHSTLAQDPTASPPRDEPTRSSADASDRPVDAGGRFHPRGPVAERGPADILASALMRALHAKDPATGRHSELVGELGARIATVLELGPERTAKVRRAARLHDVGKLAIPRTILEKETALTPSEARVMRRHPVLGQRILAQAGLDEEGAWVRHHHERPDGRGYPDRLTGAAIPVESRIIFAADAFEAVTSGRTYDGGRTVAEALAELDRHAGTQFDAGCVAALHAVAVDWDPEGTPRAVEGPSPRAALVPRAPAPAPRRPTRSVDRGALLA